MNANPTQIIAPQPLTDALTEYFRAPENKRVIISKLTLSSIVEAVQPVDIHLVGMGDSADNTNLLLKQKYLDSNQSFPVYQLEGQIMAPGDTLWAKAGANDSVLIMASGVTVV